MLVGSQCRLIRAEGSFRVRGSVIPPVAERVRESLRAGRVFSQPFLRVTAEPIAPVANNRTQLLRANARCNAARHGFQWRIEPPSPKARKPFALTPHIG